MINFIAIFMLILIVTLVISAGMMYNDLCNYWVEKRKQDRRKLNSEIWENIKRRRDLEDKTKETIKDIIDTWNI